MVFELPPMGPKVGIYSISPNINKLSLKNKKLDIFLEGGLEVRSNNVLIGPSGEEKILFALQFIQAGLEKGEPGIIITTDILPTEVEKISKKFNWDLNIKEELNLFKIIDCYSWTLGKNIDNSRQDILIQGPNALNDLSIAISKLVSELSKPEKPIRICFISLSTFLLYNESESIFKFIQIIGARLKTMGASTIFLLEEGMHDEKTEATIKHLNDNILYIKKIKKKWFLDKNDIPEKIEILIDKNGISVP
ncbi:RAD55 family ATPase [Candidatus Micrarchaeota archaeon]|nr:RAD55 family ATPase [Candidatus Micrarchaeota archaeon]